MYLSYYIHTQRQGSAEKFLSLPRSRSPQNSDVQQFSDIFGSEFVREDFITHDKQIYIYPVELCLWPHKYVYVCEYI